jgi:hypothetical protein
MKFQDFNSDVKNLCLGGFKDIVPYGGYIFVDGEDKK